MASHRWAAVRRAHGDADRTRALIEVLLHRSMAHDHVGAGIAPALKVGALTADLVAVGAHKAAQTDPPTDPQPASGTRLPVGNPVQIPDEVVSLTAHRLASMPTDARPPSVAAYDQLLRNRPAQ